MTAKVVAVVGLVLLGCGPSRVPPPVPPESPFYGGSLPRYDAALRHYVAMRDSTALGPLRCRPVERKVYGS